MMAHKEPVDCDGGVWRFVDRLSSITTLIASTMIIAAAVSLLWFGRAGAEPLLPDVRSAIEDSDPSAPLTAPLGTTVKGLPSARLAIIEFSDFQCPYCARFATGTHARLEQEFVDTGKVKYAFRNVPIEQIHPQAMGAAVAAECAGLQGRFWHMYDRIFANQAELQPPALLAHGRALGLNQREFASCLDGRVAAKISDDRTEADRLGISSTPTFLIGELRSDQQMMVLKTIKGAHPFEVFKTALEQVAEQIGARP